jgi:hypothetical protein
LNILKKSKAGGVRVKWFSKKSKAGGVRVRDFFQNEKSLKLQLAKKPLTLESYVESLTNFFLSLIKTH